MITQFLNRGDLKKPGFADRNVNTRPKTPMLGQCNEVALPWLKPCQCFLFLGIGASG